MFNSFLFLFFFLGGGGGISSRFNKTLRSRISPDTAYKTRVFNKKRNLPMRHNSSFAVFVIVIRGGFLYLF